ncbi:MAG TPA: branched-chain amino acid ABC transporter permease [Rhodocyclaceae bacterium]|nr:branched-chain amino acid ABC transporter permease [Rhodocyclaceae bacterium]
MTSSTQVLPTPAMGASRVGRLGVAAAMALTAAACSMPWWADRWTQLWLTEFLYTLALAQGWNLLAGYGGLLSVGQQAFVGIGGYLLVVFSLNLGLNPFLVIPLAGLVSAVIAVPMAAVLFRLRGAYFAVGTWVVAEVLRLLVANDDTLGGGTGTSITSSLIGVPAWQRSALTLWIALALGVGGTLLVYLLLRSRLGLALTAVRDGEAAAGSLGISVRRIKWFVYLAAAVWCGMTGALIFITKLRISPDAAFSINWTTTTLFVVVIGGIGTIEGPIIGTVVFFLLRGVLSDFGSWYLITLGAVAVLFMLWAPSGLWGLVTRRFAVRIFPVQRRVGRGGG